MGSTSVRTRQASDLVALLRDALLRGGGRSGRIGLAALLALACAERPPVGATPSGAGLHGGRHADPGRGAAHPGPVEATGTAGEAVLRVGTSGDYAPFSLWPADAREPEGFSVAVARAFAADRGARVEFVRFGWSELAADLEAGRFDLALSGITIRPDRSLIGRFSSPLTTTAATALVRAESALATAEDLARPGVRIAVNRGGHLERVARTLFGQARIEAVGRNGEVPSRLADGRADAALTDDLEAPLWQRSLPPTRAIGPLTRDRKAAFFPPGAEPLLRDFDRWLLAAEASGELAGLRRRSGLTDAHTAAPRAALLARLDERLALMPAIARAKRALARPIEDPAQEARVHATARESAARAARELAVSPPTDASLHRLVEALLAAARFVQTRTLEASPSAEAGNASASRTAGLDDAASASGATPQPQPQPQSTESARALLEERLRPAASFLMDRIVWLAVATTSPGHAPIAAPQGTPPDSVADALAAYDLPRALVDEIGAALAFLEPAPAMSRAPVSSPRRATASAPARPARPVPRDTAPSA